MNNRNMEDSTTRFSNRVENYAKYRPHYPEETLLFIRELFQKDVLDNINIADIGSGTGIFTQLLLNLPANVYGIEPNDAMRTYAEEALSDYITSRASSSSSASLSPSPSNTSATSYIQRFHSIKGTSDATGLANNSIDLITVAQAFHWFDPLPTKSEFMRILKDNGYVLLIWNDRVIEESGFSFDYETCLGELCPEYKVVTHKNITDRELVDFFSPFSYVKHELANTQLFDFEALMGRLMSSSYVPVSNYEVMEKIRSCMQNIFNTYQTNNHIQFNYMTTIYIGQLVGTR